ncbi:hypothetical protein E2562_038839 [Oryza meyeriana var. granulata]|uniref:Uncharacterized protein n=1 Tax=Oryza meyeriana var. granulata TaxID=110450 RepID=A0A6G1CMG8_9ORYZ|nr:hypothetical protein E2562_038839 [Oryza meyeriana var. granulata]
MACWRREHDEGRAGTEGRRGGGGWRRWEQEEDADKGRAGAEGRRGGGFCRWEQDGSTLREIGDRSSALCPFPS